MCMLAGNFDSISGNYAPYELRSLSKMKCTTGQFVSATPLKLLNRISWNFGINEGYYA